MEKNKKIFIIGVLVLFIVFIFVAVLLVNDKLSVNDVSNDVLSNVVGQIETDFEGGNEFLYKINYFADFEPGINYDIYVYDNYDIILDVTRYTSVLGDVPTEIITKLVFKDEIKKELVNYFEDLFKNKDNNFVEFSSGDIDDYNFQYISKIIYFEKESLIEFNEYNLNKDYDYKLLYNFMYNYEIYKFDDIVKVNKINYKNNDVDEFFVNFSDDSMNKIDNMFNELFKNYNVKELEIKDDMITDNNKNIIEAIINNEEIFMNYVFRIIDLSCNCIHNVVYFNNDFYVVINSVITGGDDIISRGNYNFDINNVLNNLDNFEKDSNNMNYKIILYDGKEYIVSHNDLRMVGLLKGLDIKWY